MARKNNDVENVIVNNTNNTMEDTTMATVNNNEFDMATAVAAFGDDLWVEHASFNPIKVGERVLVNKKFENKEGSKTKFTFELVCKKVGPKGGIFTTFTKFFTNNELKVGDVMICLNTGKQWSEEYISSKTEVQDCNIVLKNGATFTKKINTSRAYRAIGLLLR